MLMPDGNGGDMAAGQDDHKFWIIGVDDEPQNLEILEEILGDQFELTLVSSGRACLDEANVAPPDLILLDVNIQGMDGLEVCRRLKAEPDTSDIPVIFVSAYSKLEERLAGYRAGGDDYVTKPFDDEELLIKVKLALATKRQLDSLQRKRQRIRTLAAIVTLCLLHVPWQQSFNLFQRIGRRDVLQYMM
ncbi:MAG: response regulator [endosymbiont of Seepiophila jonesi]|uniref:Response regulator n=1 Tax=endosymbiont of Lamellibrachia luymesi TaxID=2200907 RepID=A0A370E232_9GAMM|nr:MAG: response regulator [endosymbiont of Seepiophila jonesi]RDH93564.1 MAG: response regulator [endosymbiont of Lamellibrachia luymesi]